MLSVLTVTSPFFLLVLAGYIATRTRLLPVQAISGLNAFVLYFALPCMLFRFGSLTPIDQLLDLPLAGLYLFSALIMIGVAVLLSRKRHLDWNNTAFGALVSTFPNTGFMGVPLLVALLGQAAAGPTIVTIFVDLVIVSSICIGISRLSSGGSMTTALRKSVRGVISNPMPWAIGLGAVASALQVQPPALIDATVRLLGDAASPVALFTIGAVLARAAVLHNTKDQIEVIHTAVWPITVLKLVLHPVLLYATFQTANALGAGIDSFTVLVVVLIGALPSASNVAILAERFHADSGRVARIVLLTTAIAFISFPATVALLRP